MSSEQPPYQHSREKVLLVFSRVKSGLPVVLLNVVGITYENIIPRETYTVKLISFFESIDCCIPVLL